MTTRAQLRRGRRSRNLRYRAPRYRNRARPAGWLPPSLQHRVDTVVGQVRRLQRWVPVQEIHMERVSFDVSALAAGRDLAGVEYQQGTLAGYEVREYLLEKWRRRCAYCGATGVPLNIDHIRPRARGGSNRIINLTLACIPCNEAKAAADIRKFLAAKPRQLERILAQAKAPLRDSAAMNATRWRLSKSLAELGAPVHAWSGGRTKRNRTRAGLPKTHTLDALSVGRLDHDMSESIVRHPTAVLIVTATGRGRYQRTTPDRYGFPRLVKPRNKTQYGFATGDLVRAVVPSGKKAGTHTGRVAVRSSGSFNVRTNHGLVQGIHHRHIRLLQRADGYGYGTQEEGGTGACPGPRARASARDIR